MKTRLHNFFITMAYDRTKDIMKPLHVITSAALTASVLLSAGSFSLAGEGPVTPYGGYCKDCAVYGSCKEAIPPGEAIQSLRKYYEARGYSLGNIRHKGRFIEAEVLQNSRQVDRVLFDRKTGRIRSLY